MQVQGFRVFLTCQDINHTSMREQRVDEGKKKNEGEVAEKAGDLINSVQNK